MGWYILSCGGAAYYPRGYGGGSSDGYGVVYCEHPLPPSAVHGCFGRIEELPGLLARAHLRSPSALTSDLPPREIKNAPDRKHELSRAFYFRRQILQNGLLLLCRS